MRMIEPTPFPPPALPGSPDSPIGHGSAFTLLFVYIGVAGVAGVLLGNLLAERYLRGRHGSEPLPYGRQIIIHALFGVACALAIFAVLSFATMLVMKFML